MKIQVSETHPRALRSRIVLLWLDLADIPSVREAARILGYSQPAISYWISGDSEPSPVSMAMMAGYYAEGESGLAWAANPALHMSGHAAHIGHVNRERALALAVCRDVESPHKQAMWRLFELSLVAQTGYPLNLIEYIDWNARETRQSSPPPARRTDNRLWLPRDPLHLACPGLKDEDSDTQPRETEQSRETVLRRVQAGYRPSRPRVSLWN